MALWVHGLFSSVKTKPNPSFTVKLAERSNNSFLLSILMNHIFETSVLLIRDNGMYRTFNV